MKQKINPEGMAMPPAPYTNIIKLDSPESMVFMSGISATNEKMEIVGKGDILTQTEQIITNIKTGLKAAGSSPEQIAMTTTYVLSEYMDDFLKSGAAGMLFEALDNPADTLVGVASLAGMKYGAMIEVSAIAVCN